MGKIEGVPEGWELVAVREAMTDDWYIDSQGHAYQAKNQTGFVRPIIRKTEPHCTWQHGIFKDGWVAQDDAGCITWFSDTPYPKHDFRLFWKMAEGNIHRIEWLNYLQNPPAFRSDLPWNERIQQVGPTYEATLRGET